MADFDEFHWKIKWVWNTFDDQGVVECGVNGVTVFQKFKLLIWQNPFADEIFVTRKILYNKK